MTTTLIRTLLTAKESNKPLDISELTNRGLISRDMIMDLEDNHIILTHNKNNTRFIVLTMKGYNTLKGGTTL